MVFILRQGPGFLFILGQVAHNEEMKQELEGIIDGLQTYLRDVNEKATNQKREYDLLLCQQEELHEKLQDLELENQQLAANEDRVQELRQVRVLLGFFSHNHR